MDLSAAVDLDRYPLHDRTRPDYAALVGHAAAALRQSGCCELPGFLTPAGIALASEQARRLAPRAFASASTKTAYLSDADPHFPNDHARGVLQASAVKVIAYDDVPAQDIVRRLYEWPALDQFLADVLGLPVLYRYADPLGALNLAVMGDGDALGWHFDQTDFVTSLALVPAEQGGDFEFHPLIRSASDECYDAVGAVVRGERHDQQRLPMTPGTFLLFQGRHSLHRVTPIRGATDRIVALLAFDSRPGTDSTPELKRARYGREYSLT